MLFTKQNRHKYTCFYLAQITNVYTIVMRMVYKEQAVFAYNY